MSDCDESTVDVQLEKDDKVAYDDQMTLSEEVDKQLENGDKVADEHQMTPPEEMSCFILESCENTNVEVTSMGHVDGDLNSNSDQNFSCAENSDTSASVARRDSRLSLEQKSELCLICDTKIYPMEKLAVDGRLYHKNCFRCSKCRTILSVTNFNLSNNSIYCKTHFMELFKIRGKYDDERDIETEVISQNQSNVEEIPTTDTKSLLEKFRQLETGPVPFPSSCSRISDTTTRYVQSTDDIVRSQDVKQDELPPPETAKAMVAKFKAMETEKNIPTPQHVQQMQLKAKANTTPNANVRLQSNVVQSPQDLIDGYNVNEELPEEGTTKNLLSKFQSLSNHDQ